MFDVIDFLERVGQDAQLRHASQDEVGLALSAAEADPELRVAILAGDGQSLATKLGKTAFCCYINPGKEDEDEDEDDKDDKDDKDGDGKGRVKKKPSRGPRK
jgi:enoyl-CoA hydratase/carnithine racemase